ncbi:MAG: hypothetical protein KAI79_06625, partial [Bacteroidales bacterium]|nr:hypothetical protein [Bacteroidales bacterium]
TGKVSEGKYSGGTLFRVKYNVEIGFSYSKMIRLDNKIIILEKYNSSRIGIEEANLQLWGDFYNQFVFNKEIVINNLSEGPENIQNKELNISLVKKNKNNLRAIIFIDVKNAKKIFEYTEKKYVYFNEGNGCFFIVREDGTIINYVLEIDFLGKEGEPAQYAGIVPSVPEIVWNNGMVNTEEYIFERTHSCGGGDVCLDYSSYIKGVSQLEELGKTTSGDKIYTVKDKNFKIEGFEESILMNMYNSYYPGWSDGEQKEKISFEEFLEERPMFFWQDPFGNFISFRSAKYLPAVECGKPVIYLYPEEEMDISVFVKPTGGFTLTEPAYNNGWFVRSTPNSEIYNYGDNKEYPYLFWEGYGLEYVQAEKGFVVKRENVHEFLVEKLAQLGLVENEYDEFIEFWEPKMVEYPYYLVSFMPKEEFDEYAPLKVEPEPDTVIRVFMDYKALNYPVLVKEPKIVTPERVGFTVVEWGGALHR